MTQETTGLVFIMSASSSGLGCLDPRGEGVNTKKRPDTDGKLVPNEVLVGEINMDMEEGLDTTSWLANLFAR